MANNSNTSSLCSLQRLPRTPYLRLTSEIIIPHRKTKVKGFYKKKGNAPEGAFLNPPLSEYQLQ
mgnify:CR=1 FL=1